MSFARMLSNLRRGDPGQATLDGRGVTLSRLRARLSMHTDHSVYHGTPGYLQFMYQDRQVAVRLQPRWLTNA